MITRKKDRGIVIDLTGPEGNALVLLGYATNWAKQMGKDPKPIITEMMSSDYENLVNVLDREFGSVVVFER